MTRDRSEDFKKAAASRVLPGRRRKIRRRTKLYIGAFAALLVALLAATALVLTTRPTTLLFAVGPIDGPDTKFIQRIADVLKQRNAAVQIALQPRPTAQDAVASVSLGSADLAVLRADQLSNGLTAVTIIRRNPTVFWTYGRSKSSLKEAIRSTNKVTVFAEQPQDADTVKRILSMEIGAIDKVAAAFRRPDDEPKSIDPNQVFVALGVAEKIVARIIGRNNEQAAILELTAAEAVSRRQPILESVSIPKSLFAPDLPADETASVALADVIAARSGISDVAAANFASELFKNRSAIIGGEVDAASITAPDTAKDAALPVHPGVAAFIDGTERTFIERYSDCFWGIILVLSGLGSLGATFRAYFYRDEQQELAQAREEVVKLAKTIRDGVAEDKLTEFDRRVDQLVLETLDRYDRGIIDEGGVAAFGLALDHYQGGRAVASHSADALLASPKLNQRTTPTK